MFESIPAAAADPILGLADLFNADKRPGKINLGIGVYKDETGQTPVMHCVKEAERYLLNNEKSKNYLGIGGSKEFAAVTQSLLFAKDYTAITEQRLQTAQAPGGTGALRIAADFLAKNTQIKRVWVSDPSWPNHHNIFKASGLEVLTYPWYDQTQHQLNFDALVTALQQAGPSDVVLFHGCCHNPTGMDPDIEQWQLLSDLALQRGWLPMFDFAYQGLGQGLDEDAAGLRLFAAQHTELLVCSSYSKNFGLYNERIGALTLQAGNAEIAEKTFSQIKSVIRANYSNPPAHGAAIVSTILSNPSLRGVWQQELTEVRQRIQRMRLLFVKTLVEKGASQDFSFIKKQNGMFSFSGLNKQQVQRLREEFGIYAVNSGRINIAGMTPLNMSRLCEAIIKVL